ncbi:hypothetical protein LEM8419_03558 [Neolewinella maritima]|uniref:Uncharacterized protein n=1 Tax=Neolewinella maritima TaxID=1383882 RepID=A0ABM9B5L3_9BACT|nr:hypothetical protein [Neolewinella maritima]CAH1002686.1 hypothetical protein LEM8419_03558 [Neolewinella maritima]
MITALCGTACGVTDGKPIPSYRAFCDGDTFREYGNPYFALIDCNVNIADITDLVAVQALVDDGSIVLSPRGKIDITAPTSTTVRIDDCVGDVSVSNTYSVAYSTYQTKKYVQGEDTDADYFADLLARHRNYRLFWFDCDEYIYATDEYVDFIKDPATAAAPTGNPGFAFTVSTVPHPVRGEGDRVRWETTFQIKVSGNEIIRYAYLPGLFAKLTAKTEEVPA